MQLMTPCAPVARRPRYKTRLTSLGLGALLLIVAGCTSVPFNKGRSVTSAFDTPGESRVTQVARKETRESGGKTTVVPLFAGNDALGARLRLIEQAEHTLDIQYFLLKPDLAGGLFSRALIAAAARGVRIRFLLDDIFTTATDEQIRYLNSYENIDVRLFNPLSRNSNKAMNFVLDFSRVNRRMHNKSLTADNAASIVGGRNIADEYFQVNTNAEFADLDMFVMGPISTEIAKTFDIFWNDSRAVPMENFRVFERGKTEAEVEGDLEKRASAAQQGLYEKATNSTFLSQIRSGEIQPARGVARVVTDDPGKIKNKVKDGPQTLANALKKQIMAVESEIILISPYFVPRPSDVEMFKTISLSGRRVIVVTNSLASTNHAYVHGGYAPRRKELLRAGVELYEIRADAMQSLGKLDPESDTVLTLHTKAAIFDASRLFVGSLNYDPRSIELNTELGVFLESKNLSSEFATGLKAYLKSNAYKLSLDEKGDILWTNTSPRGVEVETSEPGASFLQKLIAGITSVLPVTGQL